MPNESLRYSKQISDQGRERSVEVRRERAALKGRLKAGEISPADVLNDEGKVAGKIRLFAFLKNCPGVGGGRSEDASSRAGPFRDQDDSLPGSRSEGPHTDRAGDDRRRRPGRPRGRDHHVRTIE